ncbi:G-protein coupled receptor 35-like [Phascolarctos cinereus]|uniref:G-protein coupled receptor 35-like n=1 Tax=Phascolarctos cinereus TaxID=38626 RepID=A0A6P5J9X6_PHACI|nr:G-protein coupled receptor 35-like [Phascolarctos cinereus]
MNVSNSCNSALSSPGEAYIYMSFYGLLFIVGLTLNILALWVFCCRMRKWTETQVYMVNLAVADSGLILLFPIVIYFTRASCLEDLSCQVPQAIYLVNAYMSISIPMAIGVDRYVAIRFPLKAKVLRTPGQAAIVCALLWVVVISMLVFRVIWQIQDGTFCFWRKPEMHISVVVFSLLGFFIPLGILVFCTFQIVCSLLKVQRREVSEVRQIRKSVSMVLASLLMFVICFLPLHITILLNFFLGSNDGLRRVFKIFTFIAHTNCCLDAICYYFVAKEFQEVTPFFCLWRRQPRPMAPQDKKTCTTLM